MLFKLSPKDFLPLALCHFILILWLSLLFFSKSLYDFWPREIVVQWFSGWWKPKNHLGSFLKLYKAITLQDFIHVPYPQGTTTALISSLSGKWNCYTLVTIFSFVSCLLLSTQLFSSLILHVLITKVLHLGPMAQTVKCWFWFIWLGIRWGGYNLGTKKKKRGKYFPNIASIIIIVIIITFCNFPSQVVKPQGCE